MLIHLKLIECIGMAIVFQIVNTLRPTQICRYIADNILIAFPWLKIVVFCFKFHWNFFPMVQLTINQHWLGAEQRTGHYLNQRQSDAASMSLCRIVFETSGVGTAQRASNANRTVECRYNAAQYNIVLHTSLQEVRQNINQRHRQQHHCFCVWSNHCGSMITWTAGCVPMI